MMNSVSMVGGGGEGRGVITILNAVPINKVCKMFYIIILLVKPIIIKFLI